MSLFPLSGLFAAWLALAWLHGLWRLIASRDGNAMCCYAAGALIVGIAARSILPVEPLTPLWLPFFYSYASSGMAAALWSLSMLRMERNGLHFGNANPDLAAYFAALLSLHLGIALLSPLLGGQFVGLYLMLPPLMAALVYLLYLPYRLQLRRHGRLGWPVLATGTVATPLIGLALAHGAVPFILRYF